MTKKCNGADVEDDGCIDNALSLSAIPCKLPDGKFVLESPDLNLNNNISVSRRNVNPP